MRIVFFSGIGMSNDVVYAHLTKKYNLVGVVIDAPLSRKYLIKRRIKKLGYFKVFLQILFVKLMKPFLLRESVKRREELDQLVDSVSVESFENKFYPTSINDSKVVDFVKSCNADLIIVNGTRIIKKSIIDNVGISMINIHVGITPKYRGVHGVYWALVNKDKENCGVTAHLIDAGIDTGGVISQKLVAITEKDNFCTYPILQLQVGLSCLDEAIEQVNTNSIKIIENNLPSKLYYHPTITSYIYHRVVNGVK